MSQAMNMPTSQHDPYRILNLAPDASLEQIHKAYFSIVRDYDPVKQADTVQRLRSAYRQLLIQKQAGNDFLSFEEVNRNTPFQTGSSNVADIEDDLIDMEMWRLICKPQ